MWIMIDTRIWSCDACYKWFILLLAKTQITKIVIWKRFELLYCCTFNGMHSQHISQQYHLQRKNPERIYWHPANLLSLCLLWIDRMHIDCCCGWIFAMSLFFVILFKIKLNWHYLRSWQTFCTQEMFTICSFSKIVGYNCSASVTSDVHCHTRLSNHFVWFSMCR